MLVCIFTSVSLVSLWKHLFTLFKGTIVELVLEHTVHTVFAINLKKIHLGGDCPSMT